MSFEWENVVVMITGGTGGIGAQVVRFLMEEKVKHIAILDIADGAGSAFQRELNSEYGDKKVQYIHCDVTEEAQLSAAYALLIEDQGLVDVVINCAGICNDSVATFRKEIDLNVTAVISNTIKGLEAMRKDRGGKGGTIINIGSIAAIYKVPQLAIYCGTKAAVTHFTNCIGNEEFYSRTGVRVFTMCLGSTATSLYRVENMGHFDDILQEQQKDVLCAHPPQTAESAARAIVQAYTSARSGSVWMSRNDLPVKDISDTFDQSYDLFMQQIL